MNIYDFAQAGNLEAVKSILEQNAEALHETDEIGWSVFMFACMSGNLELVTYLCERGADISWVSPQLGLSALACTAFEDRAKVAAFLLAAGVDVNGDSGQSPLSVACRSGSLAVGQLLLKHKAKISPGDLVMAIQSGQTALAYQMIEQGADVNDQSSSLLQSSALAMAIHNNQTELAHFLLERGADPNLSDALKMTYISRAIAEGHFELAEGLVRKGAQINGYEARCLARENKWDSLEWALRHDQVSDTQQILALAANAQDPNLWSEWLKKFPWNQDRIVELFQKSCEQNLLTIVQQLLTHDLQLDPKQKSDALLGACRAGALDVLKWLVETAGFELSLDSTSRPFWKLPLHVAIQANQLPVVAYLLELGASTGLSQDGISPLGLACRLADLTIAQFLLECGVPVSLPLGCETGTSPLQTAVGAQNAPAVNFLLAQGADLEWRNEQGERALEKAIHVEDLGLTRLLLTAGSLLPAPFDPHYAPFFKALEHCIRGEVVKYLIEFPTHSAYLSHYGYTPLYLAIKDQDTRQVLDLLEAGEDVNQRNQWELTPLMLAASFGQLDTVKLLVERGAQLDLYDDYHYSALTWAGLEEHLDVVLFLLRSGANPSLFNEHGNTLTKLALKGSWKSIELLLQFGAWAWGESEWENGILVEACLQGELEMVKRLLNLEEKRPPHYGPHPVDAALQHQHWEVVDALFMVPLWGQSSHHQWHYRDFKNRIKQAVSEAEKAGATPWQQRWQNLGEQLL